MSATPDELDVDPRLLDTLNSEIERQTSHANMIKETLITPDRMYFDLELLRDIRLGAAITHMMEAGPAQGAVMYEHLLERLVVWAQRTFSDFAHNFPKMGLSDAQIDARLADPQWHAQILAAAPATQFTDKTITAHLAVNVNHSAVVGKTERGPDGKLYAMPIRLIINLWPLTHIKPAQHREIGEHFARRFGVECEIIAEDPATITPEQWLSYDEIYTAHAERMMTNAALRTAFSEMRFFNKRFFVLQVIRGVFDATRIPPAEFAAALGWFAPLIQFCYIEPALVSPLVTVADNGGRLNHG